MSGPIQRNAADEEQVRQAKMGERRIRENQLNDLRYLLESPQGRRFLWRLISHCRVFASIWEPSAKIHHNSGRQDVGHFILAEVAEANEEAILTMMRESKKGEMKDA